MDNSGVCRAIRAHTTYEGKQALSFVSGISAESVGATGISMHLVTIPAGERGKAHLHENHETVMYVLQGSVVTWTGEKLADRVVIESGDFMYIPAGVAHLPVNETTEPCTVVLARTDPNEQQSTVLRPDLDELNHKIEIGFNRFDVNGDGLLTRDDYVAVAQQLIDAYNESTDSPKGKAVMEGYLGLWSVHLREMDTFHEGHITRDEFHKAIARNIRGSNGVDDVVVPLMRAVLDISGLEGNGTLDRAEFAQLMRAYGVPEDHSGETFINLDKEGDGQLTFDEFVAAGRDLGWPGRSGLFPLPALAWPVGRCALEEPDARPQGGRTGAPAGSAIPWL